MKRLFFTTLLMMVSYVSPLGVQASMSSLPREEAQAAAVPSVRVDGVVIEMRNPYSEPVKFQIFSITGQLIKSVIVKTAPVRLELPKGFYIVKCDNWTKRVMLK